MLLVHSRWRRCKAVEQGLRSDITPVPLGFWLITDIHVIISPRLLTHQEMELDGG